MNYKDIAQGCLALFVLIVVVGLVIGVTVIAFLVLWFFIKSLLEIIGS